MSLIFTMLSSLLSTLPGTLGTYFAKQKELGLAQIDLEKARIESQILIAQAQATADTEFRTAELGATSSTFKQSVFYFFSAIMLYSIIMPGHAAAMWGNLNLVPDWFKTIYIAMTCAIWGIPVAKEYIGAAFSNLLSARAETRGYKIAKIKALNEKTLADELRTTIFKQGMTQPQWDAILSAVNKANQ